MLAARYYGIGDVKIEDIPGPACNRGEVLVRIAYAGICGSDLHVYRKGMFVTSTPVTMGHEFCGVVEEVGAGVTSLRPGDHVVGDPRVTCGKCRWCRAKEYNLCPNLGFIGEVSPGCFAEYIVMDCDRLLKVPQSVELLQAALVEPLAVALHIAQKGRFTPQDQLGIIGAGPIGLLTVIVARAMQIEKITVIDISRARLELAQKLGADRVLEAVPENHEDAVDVVVEAVGIEATLNGAVQWLKPKGRLVMAGLYEEKVMLDPNYIIAGELKVTGINAYETGNLQKAIDFLADGNLSPGPVISHVLPLTSAGEGFSMLTSPGVNASKILLMP